MAHARQHTADLRRVLMLDALMQLPESKGLHRFLRRGRLPDDAARLRDLQLRHDILAPRAVQPSKTLVSGTPRRCATSIGSSTRDNACMVAATWLCGLLEPGGVERAAVIPAVARAARAPPPAIPPVPGAAGFGSTSPASCLPVTEGGMDPPFRGTRTRFF